jgi:peptide deformylase
MRSSIAPRAARPISRSRRRARDWTHRASAYGTSTRDGAWREHPVNAFGALINAAKGRREVLQAGAPA